MELGVGVSPDFQSPAGSGADLEDTKIADSQIVLSHTIFRALADKFGDKPVLVIGGPNDSCRQVANA